MQILHDGESTVGEVGYGGLQCSMLTGRQQYYGWTTARAWPYQHQRVPEMV
jgi:hypothetical protein